MTRESGYRLRHVFALAVAVNACAVLAACASTPAEPTAAVSRAPAPHASEDAVRSVGQSDAPAHDRRDRSTRRARFARWVSRFRARAAANGVARETLAAAFADVELVPRIIELDRNQPEFSRRVWAYLDNLVTPYRVRLGREQLATYADIAARVERRYGVPRSIIGAIWGIESSYGRYVGHYDTVDALATLAFDGRRREFAVRQLYAVFEIIASGAIEADALRGSWAGAMGHTQFIPTSYLAYAVDGNGDGRIDIWHSIADVMASTANYLAEHGWQPGSRWGVEVVLPPGFDYAQARLTVERPTSAWLRQGVRSASGQPLPRYARASILAPAGSRGPAFLLGPNFEVIMSYNHSVNYALAVGLLSNRLAGRPGVQADWPRGLGPLSTVQVKTLQRLLNRMGFNTGGPPDGIIGPNTKAGIRAFQRAHGLVADGFATLELLRRVRRAVGAG